MDAPVKNPSLTIGDGTITFDAEVHSSDYIEYYPDENKAYLNYYTNLFDAEGNWTGSEAHTKEITFSGEVTVPAGAFTYTYKAEPMTKASPTPTPGRLQSSISAKTQEK